MHLILLFTFLYLPGIKSSYEVKPGLVSLRSNGGHTADIPQTDIAPIEEPQTVLTANLVKDDHVKSRLKPYESYIVKKFEHLKNKDAFEFRNKHEFLSNKEREVKNHLASSEERRPEGRQVQTTPRYHENKEGKHGLEGKRNEEKKYDNKMRDHKVDEHDKSKKTFKKYEGFKEEKHQSEKKRRFNKAVKKEIDVILKGKHHAEEPLKKEYAKLKKAAEEYLKKYYKHDKERKRMERTKRHTDSSESDDEDYQIDDDEDSDENVSLGSMEKQFIAHLLEGSVRDDSRPFEDAVEVKFKESGEYHGRVPVVEEKFTKKLAYVSCGRGDGPGCGSERQEVGSRQDGHVATGGYKTEDNSHEEHIDMAAWLKAFEDEIIKTGIDLKYDHQ